MGLVVVDEGHCEPAPYWREAVRLFDCPRVLCSATPYRNDLKTFDVNFDHAYSLSHGEAVRSGFVRELKVVPRARCGDLGAFVRDLVAFYDGEFANRPNGAVDPRVIDHVAGALLRTSDVSAVEVDRGKSA